MNFICNATTDDPNPNMALTITKYYGGWGLSRPYSTVNQLGDINTNINIGNGWYEFSCSGTDFSGASDSSNGWRFQTGKGEVYVFRAVDTEPESTWDGFDPTPEQDFQNFNLNRDSGNPSGVAQVMNTTWRNSINDSHGNPAVYDWHMLSNEPLCEGSNSNCDSIANRLLYNTTFNWSANITQFDDGKSWHWHIQDFYNKTEWESGVGTSNDLLGDCVDGDCYGLQDNLDVGWNQILDFNNSGHKYRNQTTKEIGDKLLGTFIIESNLIPFDVRTGWIWQDEGYSAWAETSSGQMVVLDLDAIEIIKLELKNK